MLFSPVRIVAPGFPDPRPNAPCHWPPPMHVTRSLPFRLWTSRVCRTPSLHNDAHPGANGSPTMRCHVCPPRRRTIALGVGRPFASTISTRFRRRVLALIVRGTDFSVPGQQQSRTTVRYTIASLGRLAAFGVSSECFCEGDRPPFAGVGITPSCAPAGH
jgi:hypothetical protein